MVADERSQEEEPKYNTNRYEALYLSLTQIVEVVTVLCCVSEQLTISISLLLFTLSQNIHAIICLFN